MIQFHKRGPELPESSPARFQPGHLVRHRRYGYRGVVVALDLECGAGDDWYRSNRTQPDRDQPWYHVLVHGSSHKKSLYINCLLRIIYIMLSCRKLIKIQCKLEYSLQCFHLYIYDYSNVLNMDKN